MGKRNSDSFGPTVIQQTVFNTRANSMKVSESGLDYTGGFLGAIDTAQECGANKQVLICNSAAAVAWVAFGDAAVAAPSAFADGIMIPAGSCVVLASGLNTHVRSSAATVGAYVAVEDITES